MILQRFIYYCGKFHTDTINQTIFGKEFVKLVWGKWKLFRATLSVPVYVLLSKLRYILLFLTLVKKFVALIFTLSRSTFWLFVIRLCLLFDVFLLVSRLLALLSAVYRHGGLLDFSAPSSSTVKSNSYLLPE